MWKVIHCGLAQWPSYKKMEFSKANVGAIEKASACCVNDRGISFQLFVNTEILREKMLFVSCDYCHEEFLYQVVSIGGETRGTWKCFIRVFCKHHLKF